MSAFQNRNPYAVMMQQIAELQAFANFAGPALNVNAARTTEVASTVDAFVEVVRRRIAPEITTMDFVQEIAHARDEIMACHLFALTVQWLWREYTLDLKQRQSSGLHLVH